MTVYLYLNLSGLSVVYVTHIDFMANDSFILNFLENNHTHDYRITATVTTIIYNILLSIGCLLSSADCESFAPN